MDCATSGQEFGCDDGAPAAAWCVAAYAFLEITSQAISWFDRLRHRWLLAFNLLAVGLLPSSESFVHFFLRVVSSDDDSIVAEEVIVDLVTDLARELEKLELTQLRWSVVGSCHGDTRHGGFWW